MVWIFSTVLKMDYKKCAVLLILAIFLLSISGAYAMDDAMGSEHTESNDAILAENPKNFTQLSTEINASGNTFDIQSDYAFSSENDDVYVFILNMQEYLAFLR